MEELKQKRNEIKELEKEQNNQWQEMLETYYLPNMKQSYIKTLKNIEKLCFQGQELNKTNSCIDTNIREYKNQERYLNLILKSFQTNIEQCTLQCKYSTTMEIEDCYIDCFKNIKQVVKKVHEKYMI